MVSDLILRIITRVVIGGKRLELSGTSINSLEYGANT